MRSQAAAGDEKRLKEPLDEYRRTYKAVKRKLNSAGDPGHMGNRLGPEANAPHRTTSPEALAGRSLDAHAAAVHRRHTRVASDGEVGRAELRVYALACSHSHFAGSSEAIHFRSNSAARSSTK